MSRYNVATGIAVLLVGCMGSPTDESRGGATPAAAPYAAMSSAVRWDAARASYISARQAEASNALAFAVKPGVGAVGLTATNPAMDFRAEWHEEGINIVSNRGQWRAALRVSRYGCEDTVRDIEASDAAVPTVSTNRVYFVRKAGNSHFTEWYVNGPLGVEQGFSLDRSPCLTGGAVILEVEAMGLKAEQTPAGAIELRDEERHVRLRYTDLVARDAAGVPLDATMRMIDGRIVLRLVTRNALFPVVVDPLIWAETEELFPTPQHALEILGMSISMSGSTAIIGAPYRPESIGAQGAAYVFVDNGSQWKQQQRLVPADGAAYVGFGQSVAISGDTAVIGAPADDKDIGNVRGSAYVFVRSGGSWIQQQRLRPVAPETLQFGWSVAIDGNTIVVGGSSSPGFGPVYAYVYQRSGGSWSEQQKLTAPGLGYFGEAVAVSGDTVLIGEPDPSPHPASASIGSAHVFTREGRVWTEEQRLEAAPATPDFGSAVAVVGNTALVAEGDGRVLVYGRKVNTTPDAGVPWTEQQELGTAFSYNGSLSTTVALFGEDRAVVGGSQPYPAYGYPSPLPYVFTRQGDFWTDQQPLPPSLKYPANEPKVVAMNSTSVLVGGPGYVFVYRLKSANGDPCSAASDCASTFCADGVCCNQPCENSCDVCSSAAGAQDNGVCSFAKANSPGAPACAGGFCTGRTLTCTCATDSECPLDQFCEVTAGCTPRLHVGDDCSPPDHYCKEPNCRQCADNTAGCVDYFCCDRACNGPCEACDLKPNPGTCAKIPGCSARDASDAQADAVVPPAGGTGGAGPPPTDAAPGAGGEFSRADAAAGAGGNGGRGGSGGRRNSESGGARPRSVDAAQDVEGGRPSRSEAATGCGCSVPSQPSRGLGIEMLSLAALTALRRRRSIAISGSRHPTRR